jgi:hypothetical protein
MYVCMYVGMYECMLRLGIVGDHLNTLQLCIELCIVCRSLVERSLRTKVNGNNA